MADSRRERHKAGAATSAFRLVTPEKMTNSARYNDLIVESYNTPEKFNILAAASLWTLLAGFVVFPATFTSLQNAASLSSSAPGRVVQRTIQNIPLLVMAVFFFVVGLIGVGWLWQQRRRQHLWLADRLFLPGVLNSLAGLATVLLNVYTARGGHWSQPAIGTCSATCGCLLVFSTLYVVYKYLLVPREVARGEVGRDAAAS
ncbi:hypothetical protein N0V87_010698 [Didymella glomerata]|uniref:Uncharacterized protein n=1 Tax=Didymella glomerata TaxID=749621 RepID=A0A9W8WPD3_9PLEO|nr:hypothetical protein N0V87_010698 [Didymella glomerata]